MRFHSPLLSQSSALLCRVNDPDGILLLLDASSALWKVYSRVRMTIAETHTPNPLDTMTEYWHAVMPFSNAESGSALQASTLCNQNTAPSTTAAPYALVTSSFQSVRSSAAEQGKLLAQRSRTSFNWFLDSVLDSATTLAESNAAHESYSDEDEHKSTVSQMAAYGLNIKSARPQLQRQPTPRLKFFVGEDDADEDDQESEDEAFEAMAVRRSVPLRIKATSLRRQAEAHDCHYENFAVHDREAEISYEEEADVFDAHTSIDTLSQSKRSGILSHFHHASPPAALERRQSLLSDLLQAEKEQRRQEDLYRCNHLTNLNGDYRNHSSSGIILHRYTYQRVTRCATNVLHHIYHRINSD
ncbi:hypothetical protein BGZ68_007838 [Mortierella alpina]|nr:hypothetical protein BGZ68_007838 [Mortierella alpina]